MILLDIIKAYFKSKPNSLTKLLNAIGEAEGARPSYWSGNPYDLTIGRDHYVKADESKMTVGEVKALQHQLVKKGAPSGAVGKYQFINRTLVGLQSKMKFKDTDLFSPELQDKMAIELLNRRGLQEYLKGKMNTNTFMRNLSKEWASLPNPDTGKSYYGQRTHFTVNQMFNILEDIKRGN